MAFKFYIDGQLTDQPVNDMQLSSSIVRDNVSGGVIVAPTRGIKVIYNNNNNLEAGTVSGYQLLKTAFDLGSCNELNINIYNEVSGSETILNLAGVIKVPQMSVDEQSIVLQVNLQDNSFYAYINNNKSIIYNVLSTVTKSSEVAVPPEIYEVDCFDSATGIYGSTVGLLFRGYRVYDIFKYLISVMSDNKVAFESVYLKEEPELFIFDGFALSHANTDPTVLTSFVKLYEEINKIKNIRWFIDTTDPFNPVFRLEDKASLYSGTQVFEFLDIKDLVTTINTSDIYGTVLVGASDNDGGAGAVFTFESGISYLGWREEVYAPKGQCNTDNEFNLVNEYGITSNDINNQLIGAVDEDKDKMFLIECEDLDTTLFTADAKRYVSWINTSDFYYNQGTNNPAKLLNHNSNYQTGLTNTLEIGGNGFRAERGQDNLMATQDVNLPEYAGFVAGYTIPFIVFTDETTGNNYDGGGNYDNVFGNYTVPDTGVYSFNTRLNIDMVSFPPTCLPPLTVSILTSPDPSFPAGLYTLQGFVEWGATYILTIEVYTDNTYATLLTSQVAASYFVGSQTTSIVCSLTANLPAGSEVRVKINTTIGYYIFGTLVNSLGQNVGSLPSVNLLALFQNGWNLNVQGCGISGAHPSVYMLSDSFFNCTGSPDGGGVEIDNDPAIYKDKEHSFTYEIGVRDWRIIKDNPTGKFAFEKDGITRFGWAKDIKRDDQTGVANIKLES